MLRGLRRRLDRLWDAYRRDKAIRDSLRDQQGAHEKFVAAIRAGLTRAGIDPDSVPAMRCQAESDPVPPSQPYRPPAPGELLREKLLRIVRHYRNHSLDLNRASAMDLFALYCFVPDAPGVSYISPETA
jgi:hypothetical protein